jgi:hypothetical protein
MSDLDEHELLERQLREINEELSLVEHRAQQLRRARESLVLRRADLPAAREPLQSSRAGPPTRFGSTDSESKDALSRQESCEPFPAVNIPPFVSRFTRDDAERYSRHLLLRGVGAPGQAMLLSSRILIVGAGGLGSPCILYLAAAGVGTIGIVDSDSVERGNLQRQVIHSEESLGMNKADSAALAIARLNPAVTTIAIRDSFGPHNALLLVSQ